MQNTIKLYTLATISSAALIVASLGFSSTASAGSVLYADPVPAGASYPGCLTTGATGADGGISYEWTAKLGKKDSVSFVNHVGAKSYNEPTTPTPPVYTPPETGWEHTSNWIALELTHRSKVRIEIERQEGVPFTNGTIIATARNKLIPAISVYAGWDNTSCEEHRYNNSGNVDWNTVEFIGNQTNEKGRSVAVYKAELNAGQYSVAIGGSPSVLETYPANNCDATDPVCYAYTGRHGYRATITTSH